MEQVLWGAIKNKGYSNQPETTEGLKHEI